MQDSPGEKPEKAANRAIPGSGAPSLEGTLLNRPAFYKALGDNMPGATIGDDDPGDTSLNRETDISVHNISIPDAAREACAACTSNKSHCVFSDVSITTLFGDAIGQVGSMPLSLTVSNDRLYIFSTEVKDPQNIHADLQICSIKFDPASGKIQIFSQWVSDGLLRVFFTRFPQCPFVNALRDVLSITNPNASDAEKYEIIVREAKETANLKDEMLSRARDNRISGVLMESDRNSRHIHCVFQGEYAVTNPKQVRWLATHGATDCFIVGISPKEAQQDGATEKKRPSALAHIDGVTDELKTLQAMRAAIGLEAQADDVRHSVIILGGSPASVKNMIRAYWVVRQWEKEGVPIDIIIGNIFTGNNESLAIDLENGILSRFVPTRRPENLKTKILDVMSSVRRGKAVARRNDPQS